MTNFVYRYDHYFVDNRVILHNYNKNNVYVFDYKYLKDNNNNKIIASLKHIHNQF